MGHFKTKYLTNERGCNLHSHELLLPLLGFKPSSPIPLDFEGIFTIQGVKVVVKKPPVKGRRKHRIFAVCPDCSREIPAGRLHQHVGTRTCTTA